MRRRLLGIALAAMMSLVLVLTGCGKKDAGAIVKDLDKLADKMESYTTTGTMTLNTGAEPQEYQVEVSFQKPSYYRIALSNQKKDISQIVLKNDDGVFVLTPHLNKSFRFQSEWPDNQGQVYLYKSLVNSINQDKERHFTTDGDSYVFDVLANYSNASLSRQKIWLNKKTYAPQNVEIYDSHNNPVVVMTFNDFKFNEAFEKDYFDMQRNMTGARLTLPTLGQQETTKAATGTAATGTQPAAKPQEVSVIEPSYIPQGVSKPQISETKLGDSQAILLKYMGAYNYTLLESRPSEKSASALTGDLIDLGYGFGVLTGDQKKTLTWMYEGTEFRLSASDLPVEEMVQIAVGVQGSSVK